jgi:hypothetical protein
MEHLQNVMASKEGTVPLAKYIYRSVSNIQCADGWGGVNIHMGIAKRQMPT